jgi:hypothetical protein
MCLVRARKRVDRVRVASGKERRDREALEVVRSEWRAAVGFGEERAGLSPGFSVESSASAGQSV